MTKRELMENYTQEQLADRIVILNEFFTRSNIFNSLQDSVQSPLEKSIEDNYKSKIQQKEAKISRLEKEREELRNQRNEQMTIVNELKQKIKTLEEQSVHDSSKTLADFLPAEPINVADILINSFFNPRSVDENGTELVFYKRKFNISELRQIAEHLLVHCNANQEDQP